MKNERTIWVNNAEDWDDSDDVYDDNWIISAGDLFRTFEYDDDEPLVRLPLAA